MKKTMLFLCLALVLAISAQAQPRGPHPRKPYPLPKKTMPRPRQRVEPANLYNPIGEFRVHVIADLGCRDLGAILRHNIPYHFSVGAMGEYQIGHITSVGLGAEFLSSYGERCRLFYNMQETYIHTIPVYANLKFGLPHAAISPFIEGRIGYSLPAGRVTCLDPNGTKHYKSTGLYTGGAIGLKIHRAYLSYGISVIDVVDGDLGLKEGRKDVITDHYIRLSVAF